MIIGGREFDVQNRCYIMGILNVTPDSFSDGGMWNDRDRALRRAEEMIAEGADIIDIGGESTKPGYVRIGDAEEIERVVPVIEAVKSEFAVPVSVDTYKSAVAEAALRAGADMVNDIWGFRWDPKIAEVTARYGASCVLMHNRDGNVYGDLIADMLADLEASVRIALDAGVDPAGIVIDPGVGFGKDREQNLTVINRLDEFGKLGYPVLLGTSRKSVIGLTLDLPKDQRLEGTLATTVFGVVRGCSFVRVHDIKENKRVIDMSEAILAG